MSVELVYELEQDPDGYAPRPDLFARNLTWQPITFNLGRIRWQLQPKTEPDSTQPLPWTVAKSPGFTRLWERGYVEVSLDPNFTELLTELPVAKPFAPYVHTQNIPQSVTVIPHDLNRNGPVKVVMFSLDGNTEYTDFFTEMITPNTCRVTTDDPLTFVATVF
jgi:hypothetical protein